MSDDILVDTPEPGVRRITLNRPGSLNAFTYEMYDQLFELLESGRHDPDVRVVIMTGAGKGFCSGHDLKDGGTNIWASKDVGGIYVKRVSMTKISTLPVLMRSLPQPIIAAVNGTTAGLGYAIALAADMAVAARSARFINSFHNAAVGAELGMSYMLPRAVGSQCAAELLLTARPVAAEEAERIGLVLRTVDDDGLMDTVLAIAKAIMVNVPIGIALTKQNLWLNQSAPSLDMAIEFEARASAMATMSQDAAEKRAAFWEKRPPVFVNR